MADGKVSIKIGDAQIEVEGNSLFVSKLVEHIIGKKRLAGLAVKKSVREKTSRAAGASARRGGISKSKRTSAEKTKSAKTKSPERVFTSLSAKFLNRLRNHSDRVIAIAHNLKKQGATSFNTPLLKQQFKAAKVKIPASISLVLGDIVRNKHYAHRVSRGNYALTAVGMKYANNLSSLKVKKEKPSRVSKGRKKTERKVVAQLSQAPIAIDKTALKKWVGTLPQKERERAMLFGAYLNKKGASSFTLDDIRAAYKALGYTPPKRLQSILNYLYQTLFLVKSGRNKYALNEKGFAYVKSLKKTKKGK